MAGFVRTHTLDSPLLAQHLQVALDGFQGHLLGGPQTGWLNTAPRLATCCLDLTEVMRGVTFLFASGWNDRA